MTASGTESEGFTLIRTKLQEPRLPGDLIPRQRLLDRLHAGSDRKLTLISAMAGTGKTTLMAQWLEESPLPSAWLSLDEHDNDRIVFLSYLCSAIGTVFPSACDKARHLLHAPQTPSARAITTLIVNELDELVVTPSQAGSRPQPGMILALDDYHTITEPAIHEIVSGLLEHLPQGVHLALATRTDPRLPLAGLRARREMTEVRSVDLRFTSEEAHALLEGTLGSGLAPETARLLEDKTEGWAVGLRLAALSMRTRLGDEAFAQRFRGTSSALSNARSERRVPAKLSKSSLRPCASDVIILLWEQDDDHRDRGDYPHPHQVAALQAAGRPCPPPTAARVLESGMRPRRAYVAFHVRADRAADRHPRR
jgi:ATP/maltotriose-dependent transcriptional regulator MalT